MCNWIMGISDIRIYQGALKFLCFSKFISTIVAPKGLFYDAIELPVLIL